MGFPREHFRVQRTSWLTQINMQVCTCVCVHTQGSIFQSVLPVSPKFGDVQWTTGAGWKEAVVGMGKNEAVKDWSHLVYPLIMHKVLSWGRQKREGEISRGQVFECGLGKRVLLAQQGHKKLQLSPRGMLADRYFLLDSKQVATSKASIPRGQYIINNLKTWPRVIVSQGARESCPLRSRRPGFLYSFHKPAPSLSPCGLTGHPPCWLASASSLMVSFPCDFPSAPTEPVPPL